MLKKLVFEQPTAISEDVENDVRRAITTHMVRTAHPTKVTPSSLSFLVDLHELDVFSAISDLNANELTQPGTYRLEDLTAEEREDAKESTWVPVRTPEHHV